MSGMKGRRRNLLLSLAVVLIAGCASQPSATPAASPTTSASPAQTPTSTGPAGFAAVEQAHQDGSYSIFLVSGNGRIVAQASAAGRSTGYWGFGPTVSASNDKVYFLDGDSTIKSLAPDGTPAVIAHLPSTVATQAHFAVSPDDRRIAVALLTYGALPPPTPLVLQPDYKGMTLYVADLSGANRIDLFSSPTVVEWPVGWHGTQLVLAVSTPGIPGLGRDPYPYFAFNGYHVADSATGNRLATLCPQAEGNADGMPTQDGVLCDRYDGSAYLAGWSGVETRLGQPPQGSACFALEPETRNIACYDNVYFSSASGEVRQLPGAPLGFVDPGHLLVVLTSEHKVVVDDVATSSTTQVPLPPVTTSGGAYSGAGFVAARLPGGL
jgi:hypothetical protein